MGLRDRLYVGKPFRAKIPLRDTRDFVAVKDYIKALNAALVKMDKRTASSHQQVEKNPASGL